MQGSRERVAEACWGPRGSVVSRGVAAVAAAPRWGWADCFVWRGLAG